MLSRRSFFAGLGALVAAPAVIRTPGLLMPVRTIAAAPWAFDPVAMAIRCTETWLGVDADEAERLFLASNADAEKWADAANHDHWRDDAPVVVPENTGLIGVKIGGRPHVWRTIPSVFGDYFGTFVPV